MGWKEKEKEEGKGGTEDKETGTPAGGGRGQESEPASTCLPVCLLAPLPVPGMVFAQVGIFCPLRAQSRVKHKDENQG